MLELKKSKRTWTFKVCIWKKSKLDYDGVLVQGLPDKIKSSIAVVIKQPGNKQKHLIKEPVKSSIKKCKSLSQVGRRKSCETHKNTVK